MVPELGKMRRENSPTSRHSSLSPSSSERLCDYKKLNLIAFAGTLVYIGYIFGCMEKGSEVPLKEFVSFGDGSGSDDRARGSLRAATAGAPGAWISEEKNVMETNEEEEKSMPPLAHKAKVGKSTAAYTKGPVVHKHMGPVTSINLLGERHSGTNWITDHLVDCFGDRIKVETSFTRFKHWFQIDDPTIRNESALVIAMFRDPYDWVEAMRERPHHAHQHIGMGWKDFVTKPWVGPRGAGDQTKIETAKAQGLHIEKSDCLAGYKFDEVIPCSSEDSIVIDGYSNYMYELKHDESHRAYGSVSELRTNKIRNFLDVSKFNGVKAFFPQRYEALSLRGTADFLKQVEEVTGLKPKCKPFDGTGVVKHKNVDPEYTKWMNKYHDWNVEAMIGYVSRDPIPRKDVPLTLEQEELEAAPSQPANAQIK